VVTVDVELQVAQFTTSAVFRDAATPRSSAVALVLVVDVHSPPPQKPSAFETPTPRAMPP